MKIKYDRRPLFDEDQMQAYGLLLEEVLHLSQEQSKLQRRMDKARTELDSLMDIGRKQAAEAQEIIPVIDAVLVRPTPAKPAKPVTAHILGSAPEPPTPEPPAATNLVTVDFSRPRRRKSAPPDEAGDQ